ncbi:hypothetical protein BUALT_Bualt15G0092500 [Buddleja alternifolia]|uniref:WD repeat-containing protein 55 n=1 Tax=Buddleja alternifolia TaxID=168488 RepID=A0AAV6WDS8_9LAMI|nr:hypothetical protein BUALT_Bualt15G0092500 [Buddleja alternifolia]
MEIDLVKQPLDLHFHPSSNVVAAGLINGKLFLYATESQQPQSIITGSEDRSILATDVETGTAIARLKNSHRAPISRVVNLTESTIASGDDEGCIKVWDARHRSCCSFFNVHEDVISDMTFASDSMKLIGTSGDGTLSVCNLRSNRVQTQSEFAEDELLSVVIMKNGRKVICGTQTGALLLYSWGFFKDYSDRFVGLAGNPVNALLKVSTFHEYHSFYEICHAFPSKLIELVPVILICFLSHYCLKLDEERIITGCENGLSLVGILPNRIIQPFAMHSKNYHVERLAYSHDRKFLGSISHDENLKLWDLDELLQATGNTAQNPSAASHSESDGMEVDNSTPKPSRI